MSARHARTATPVRADGAGGAVGMWGLWLGLLVLGMLVAGLAAAALYLETSRPAPTPPDAGGGWPPAGVEPAGVGLAVLALVLALAATACLAVARRRLERERTRAAMRATALATASWAGAVGALVADLRTVPFRWDEHAVTSVHWVLTGTALTLLAVGALLAAGVAVLLLVGLVDPERRLELDVAAHYGWFALAAAALLLALVHLLPRAGAG